jgi:intein/homing endonuclease
MGSSFQNPVRGKEGGNKCLVADTMVVGDRGLLTLDEIFATQGVVASCSTRVEPHRVVLANEHGRPESTTHFTWNGRRRTYRIRTCRGLELRATARHPIRIMGEDGFIVWRNAEDLRTGDVVVVGQGMQCFGSDTLTADEATLLGYLVADGYIAGRNCVGFSNNDPEVEGWYRAYVGRQFNVTPKRYPQKDTAGIEHPVHSQEFRTLLLERYGLEHVRAARKTVPRRVRQAGREAQIAFLRAYMELESSMDVRKIEVTSASRQLLAQVQLMLLNLGIMSGLHRKPVNGTEYYRLNISGEHSVTYLRQIGYATQARQPGVQRLLAVPRVSDRLPHLAGILGALRDAGESTRETGAFVQAALGRCDIGYTRLAQFLDHFGGRVHGPTAALLEYLRVLVQARYVFDPIDEVVFEPAAVPTFDVVMPETHSFWSNGFLSHNTTLA